MPEKTRGAVAVMGFTDICSLLFVIYSDPNIPPNQILILKLTQNLNLTLKK